jgi:hypothetical protein
MSWSEKEMVSWKNKEGLKDSASWKNRAGTTGNGFLERKSSKCKTWCLGKKEQKLQKTREVLENSGH